jgi:hypothetical protein
MLSSRRAATEIENNRRRVGLIETIDRDFYGISCRVHKSTDFSHTSSGNWLDISHDTERWDTDAMHTTGITSARITFNRPGLYAIIGQGTFEPNSTGIRGLRILLNGTTTLAQNFQLNDGASLQTRMTVATQWMAVATDYVTLGAWQNSGGTLAV